VVRRLHLFEEATRSVGSGNLDVQIAIAGTDEISYLAKEFNQMPQNLKEARRQLAIQQQALMASSKMSALGEMAGGIAHEINTPLAIILMRTEQLEDLASSNNFHAESVKRITDVIVKTTNRISRIIKGLKSFSRDGSQDPLEVANLKEIIDETLLLCLERHKNNSIEVSFTE